MAIERDQYGNPVELRTPNTSARIFGLDQDNFYGSLSGGSTIGLPRPKFLFVVRFVRGVGEGNAKWRDGLSFAVKSVDRPKVSITTKELNQYNKKRVINTGVNYSPITIDFHDTTDSIVSSMWHEYASHYVGDFNRETDFDWKYDVTTPNYYDTGGFGIVIPPNGNAPLESSYFFEKIECFQFSNGLYTQFDLIHPKIMSYDPDNMDYSNSTGGSIRMTIGYESIIYHNQSQPVSLSANRKLYELYGDQISGNVYEPEGSYNRPFFTDIKNRAQSTNRFINSIGKLIGNDKLMQTQIVNDNIMHGLGVLSSYGVFDFGGAGRTILDPITGTVRDITGFDFSEAGDGYIRSNDVYMRGMNAQALEIAAGQAQANMKPNSQTQGNMAKAYVIADQQNKPLMSVINQTQPSSAQIGKRTQQVRDDPIL